MLRPKVTTEVPPSLPSSKATTEAPLSEIVRFFVACGCVLGALIMFAVVTSKAQTYECLSVNVGVVIGGLFSLTFILWIIILIGCVIFVKLPSRATVRETFFWSLLSSALIVAVWRFFMGPVAFPDLNVKYMPILCFLPFYLVYGIFVNYPFKKT